MYFNHKNLNNFGCIFIILFYRSLLVGDCKWNGLQENEEMIMHLPNEDSFRNINNNEMTIIYDKDYILQPPSSESEEEVS